MKKTEKMDELKVVKVKQIDVPMYTRHKEELCV